MTATKNVYALMLALVIVLSGCFGNTADDTDAQTPDESTDSANSRIEMIAIGGSLIDTGDDGGVSLTDVAEINTTSGQIIKVHEADVQNGRNVVVTVTTECVGGEWYQNSPANDYQLVPYYLPGSFTDCTHTLSVSNFLHEGDSEQISWSFVYSISAVTIG